MPWGQYGVHMFQEISMKYYLYSILSFSYLVRVKASKKNDYHRHVANRLGEKGQKKKRTRLNQLQL